MKNKIIAISLLLLFILTSGFGCKGVDKEVQEAMKPITLEYWRVFDGPDTFEEIIKNYNRIHPFINIEYKKLRYEEYEDELLNALAEDRGPDMFSIHNTWMKKYENKIKPLPEQITMAYPVEKGSIKKEIIPELRTKRTISPKQLKDIFVDVVSHDVVFDDNKIYGLPMYVDTLALYYNRSLLNNAGIATIPKYWNSEFQQSVKKLTKHDNRYGIIQSGVSLGGSDNIERYSDILSLLMMQNGAIMLNDSNQVQFHSIPPAFKSDDYNPGLEALRFYTDFSNPTKEVYSWNEDLNSSMEMFISGNLALTFSYSYSLEDIKNRAPKLNFSVAKMPQIEGNPIDINFANYWIEVVSKKSKYADEAWDFIHFATSQEQVTSYLDETNKPTAIRSIISEQEIENPELSIFANQTLTARSWYQGESPQAMEEIMGEMIDSIINKESELIEAINLAASKVQQTIN
ncbi:MAG TPA: extracellular solute-binding protein [Patescibacteria group bacterium]|nr:extracellular solute-binding protein [Patescibacteria group bacterium]